MPSRFVNLTTPRPLARVEEGVKPELRIERGWIFGGVALEDASAGIELPQDMQLLAEAVVVDGLERADIVDQGARYHARVRVCRPRGRIAPNVARTSGARIPIDGLLDERWD